MGRIKDLTGQRFGRLVVEKIDNNYIPKNKSDRCKHWICLCDCGKTVSINSSYLLNGTTQSCGCYRTDLIRKPLNVGDKYGRLKLISPGEPYIKETQNRKYIRYTWNCQCDCGNIVQNVLEKELKSGHVKSCGCLIKENCINNAQKTKKYCTYDLTGEYGIGYDNKGKPFYFDLEDYDLIKDYCWNVKNDKYVESKKTSLHRVVMHVVESNIHIDHIDHNPSNCRKNNLRIVNREQNQANSKTYKNNTSGYKGVYYSNSLKKWVASLQAYNKTYKKSFTNKDDAIIYRKYLEDKYQGDYSYSNSMKEGNKKCL